jgi:hypothetical protein
MFPEWLQATLPLHKLVMDGVFTFTDYQHMTLDDVDEHLAAREWITHVTERRKEALEDIQELQKFGPGLR